MYSCLSFVYFFCVYIFQIFSFGFLMLSKELGPFIDELNHPGQSFCTWQWVVRSGVKFLLWDRLVLFSIHWKDCPSFPAQKSFFFSSLLQGECQVFSVSLKTQSTHPSHPGYSLLSWKFRIFTAIFLLTHVSFQFVAAYPEFVHLPRLYFSAYRLCLSVIMACNWAHFLYCLSKVDVTFALFHSWYQPLFKQY